MFRSLCLSGLLVIALPASAALGADPMLSGDPIGTLSLGTFAEGATEIVAYDPETTTVFSINGETGMLDVISLADPAAPTLTKSLDLAGSPTSVATSNGLVAVAVGAQVDGDPGSVVLFDTAGTELSRVTVGVDPDSVHFTPDGSKILTADEGEPNDDYSVDGEGSVTIIDLAEGPAAATATVVGFGDFNEGGSRAAELPGDVRIYGPKATVAQDLEPEYIAISPDGTTAWVSLQENNAIAVIDIPSASVTTIAALGAADFSAEGHGIDPTDEDGGINIANWPAFGMYMPDQMGIYTVGDTTYLVTANEGDSRDFETFSEEGEVGEMELDAAAFPDATQLQAEGALGKLETSLASGDTDGDGDYDAIFAGGSRSFSIRDASDLSIVYDSGDDFEQTLAELHPDDFNSTHDEQPSFEDRSDNAGPEPEGMTIGTIGERTYAFIGLERMSGIMVYDITSPTEATYVTYLDNRDFAGDPVAGTAGDLGPEGLVFVPAADSPTGTDLLLVSNEVSGTLTVWSLAGAPAA